MPRRLLVLPAMVLLLSGCAAGATEPDVGAAPAPSASASPQSPSPAPTSSPEPSVEPVDALPPLPQSCADLDSPAAAAAAEAADYAPNAREWDPQSVDGLPAPVLTCLWAPDGGSDSLVTVGVYEVDDAAIAAIADDWQWTISEVAGVELHYRGPLDTEFYAGEYAWATREGRLVYVMSGQSVAGLPIAQAVVPTVLGG